MKDTPIHKLACDVQMELALGLEDVHKQFAFRGIRLDGPRTQNGVTVLNGWSN